MCKPKKLYSDVVRNVENKNKVASCVLSSSIPHVKKSSVGNMVRVKYPIMETKAKPRVAYQPKQKSNIVQKSNVVT